MESSNYKDAIDYYQKANDYSDAKSKKIEATYEYGCILIDKEEYDEALRYLKGHTEQERFVEKINEAEYGYIVKHGNGSEEVRDTAYEYAQSLIRDNYPGAQELFDKYFSWRVEITAINDSETSTTNMSSISMYDKVYVHYKVYGEPYKYQNITYSGQLPTCSPCTDKIMCYSGDEGWVCFYFETGSAPGIFKVNFYDSEGKGIGSGSATLR